MPRTPVLQNVNGRCPLSGENRLAVKTFCGHLFWLTKRSNEKLLSLYVLLACIVLGRQPV